MVFLVFAKKKLSYPKGSNKIVSEIYRRGLSQSIVNTIRFQTIDDMLDDFRIVEPYNVTLDFSGCRHFFQEAAHNFSAYCFRECIDNDDFFQLRDFSDFLNDVVAHFCGNFIFWDRAVISSYEY